MKRKYKIVGGRITVNFFIQNEFERIENSLEVLWWTFGFYNKEFLEHLTVVR
jgi:hypothetical protein